jgi:hypothetical protein
MMENYVDGVIMFLYIIDKPGEVHNGRPNIVNGLDVNVPERWGRNPGHEIV